MRLSLDRRIQPWRRRIRIPRERRRRTTERRLRLSIPSRWRTSGSIPEDGHGKSRGGNCRLRRHFRVEMRLTAGGVRELHWHVPAEWAIMLYGHARITAVDQEGRSFVSDVGEGDLWLFPKGVPHSIQGLGPDGCRFLLVFDDGDFNEFE